MNNEIKWKYSHNFKFRGDLTKMINGKVANCLDEDIGGFVGLFLFDSVDDIKDNSDVMKDTFRNVENLEVGDSIIGRIGVTKKIKDKVSINFKCSLLVII